MRWAERESGVYLLRKVGTAERSLGVRSPKTEEAYNAFMHGREVNSKLLVGISTRLDEMAPVNRAMGLGRLPVTPARILRECDSRDLLGEQIFVVGTNALYAYEALTGIQFASGLVATADIDLLFDARRRMSIVARDEINQKGLIGILQHADKSFTPQTKRGFRAVNEKGYLVDLIRPQARKALEDRRAKSLSENEDDLEGAAIFGLDWLINAPKIQTVAIDERGYPAPIVAVDPRVYALHKFWLAGRTDRDKVKVRRDYEQAVAVSSLAVNYLKLSFEASDLSALPDLIRQIPAGLAANKNDSSKSPKW
ncbi:MAG: hypothetical protein DHS20C05_00270 [Hyphococcus sp.]|nr:MAG: hypothetical protein DHS20C05_00270 [Marinicaulis sp.]